MPSPSVWTSSDGSNTEVYLHDTTTGVTTQLTDNDLDEEFVTIEGDHVVWNAYGEDIGEDCERPCVFYYDISTADTVKVSGSSSADPPWVHLSPPTVEAGRIAWGDHTRWEHARAEYWIHVYDIASESYLFQSFHEAPSDPITFYPFVDFSGGIVAWMEESLEIGFETILFGSPPGPMTGWSSG